MKDTKMTEQEALFTESYIDTVFTLSYSKESAREFLEKQLYDNRDKVSRQFYFDTYQYIDTHK